MGAGLTPEKLDRLRGFATGARQWCGVLPQVPVSSAGFCHRCPSVAQGVRMRASPHKQPVPRTSKSQPERWLHDMWTLEGQLDGLDPFLQR